MRKSNTVKPGREKIKTKEDMMKQLLATILVSALFVCTATTSFAASAKCTVVEISGDHLVIDCGEKGKKFGEGTKIKIKTVKVAQVEGC
jgi:hypothetical protein